MADSIYKCKDGRMRVYVKETKKVMSYPKYLIEKTIGRPLEPYEEVHHLDCDPLNNNLSNLQIRHHGEHQKEHSTKYHDMMCICPWCKKEFLWTAESQRRFYSDRSRLNKTFISDKPFCSRHCRGSFSAAKQYGHIIDD